MKTTLLIVLLVGSVVVSQAQTRCACMVSDESTRSGANESIVIAEKERYRQLEGVVKDVNGQVMPDVLVEVFDKPDYLLLSYPESERKRKEQKRLAGCVVSSDGRFCFRALPPGNYELRFSKDGGWKHTSGTFDK